MSSMRPSSLSRPLFAIVLMVTPNDQHQRPGPAAAEQRLQPELNGWLRSAACCGWMKSLVFYPSEEIRFRYGTVVTAVEGVGHIITEDEIVLCGNGVREGDEAASVWPFFRWIVHKIREGRRRTERAAVHNYAV